jgi:hypothetical protein
MLYSLGIAVETHRPGCIELALMVPGGFAPILRTFPLPLRNGEVRPEAVARANRRFPALIPRNLDLQARATRVVRTIPASLSRNRLNPMLV